MNALAGAGRLLRLAARRDRVVVPAWVLAVGGLAAGVVGAVSGVYTSAEERAAAAAFKAASVPARAFEGPASGTELGAMAVGEAYVVLAILVALMSASTVVRHTRADEESARAELLDSAVVGRQARLAAAMALALGLSVAAGAAVALALLVNGLAVAGSVAAGAAVGGVGVVFAGIAAVAAQVFSSSRAASTAAGAALGGAFLLRAVGDAAGEVVGGGVEVVSAWPSWLSSLGWGQQVRPFHQDNWEVLWLFAAFAVVLVSVAVWLTGHRDVGFGMVAVRPGPPVAPATLRGSLGLSWRLHRTGFFGWAVGLAVVGAAFGAIADDVDDVGEMSAELERALLQMAPGAGMTDVFVAFTMGFLGVAVAAFTTQVLLRMRAEEGGGRLEPVLAGAVARVRWLGSHVAVAVVGTVVLLTVTGLAGALALGLVADDWPTAWGQVGAALAQVPAVLVLGAVVVAAFGLVPRWSVAIGWVVLAAALVMGQLGALLELPQLVLNLSPFTHVPAVPAEVVAWSPVVWLLGVAVALGAVGAVAFRRRDLAIAA